MDLAIAFLVLALIASLFAMARFFSLFGRISIIGTVFLTLFVMHGVSAIPYSLGFLERDMLVRNNVPVSFPLVLGMSFLCFVVGALAATHLLHFDLRIAQRSFFAGPMAKRLPSPGRYLMTCSLAVGLGLLFAFGAGQTGLQLLAVQSRQGAELRDFRMSFVETNPYFYIGSYAKNFLVPIAMLVAFNVGAVRHTRAWRFAGWSLFLFLVVISVANLHKFPVIVAFLYLVLNHLFRTTVGGRASFRPLALIGGAILVLGSLLYYLTYDLETSDALYSTFYRVFVIPQQCLEGFLQIYPDVEQFNGGLGVGLLARLLGSGSYVSPPFLVGETMTGESGVSANAFWSSELWAAFGYPGVILGSLAVGALFVALERWSLARPRTPVSVAAYAYLVVAAIGVLNVSIFTSLLSGGIALAPLAVLILERRSPPRPLVRGSTHSSLSPS